MIFFPTPESGASDNELLIERNARGGWSLRFTNDPIEDQMGNYPTAGEAAEIAALNVTHWRIIDAPDPQPTTPS